MTTQQRVTFTLGQVWDLVTEHGTRHLIDPRDPRGSLRRTRIPGAGRPEHPLDGRCTIVSVVPTPGDAPQFVERVA